MSTVIQRKSPKGKWVPDSIKLGDEKAGKRHIKRLREANPNLEFRVGGVYGELYKLAKLES